MALGIDLVPDTPDGELCLTLPLLTSPSDRPSHEETKKKRRRRPDAGGGGSRAQPLPESEEVLDMSLANLPTLNRGSAGAMSMVDVKREPDKGLGRVASWQEPKSKKGLGSQGRKKSANDMKTQLLDTPIMELLDGNLLDIEIRVKNDDGEFVSVRLKVPRPAADQPLTFSLSPLSLIPIRRSAS